MRTGIQILPWRGALAGLVRGMVRKESTGSVPGYSVKTVGETLPCGAINNLKRMSMSTRQFFIAVGITL